MMCGGKTENREPSVEEVELLKALQPEIEGRLGAAVACFVPVLIATQVVAGTNYFAKVRIDESGGHVHIRVFKALPHTGESPKLHGLLAEKSADDELVYFEAN